MSGRTDYNRWRFLFGRTADLRADFDAMRHNRFRSRRNGLLPTGSSGDYHYRHPERYYELIEIARDMDRNDAIIAPAVDRAVWNTVQNGFTVDPQTPDENLNLELERRWREWADDAEQCEASGMLNFAAIQEQVFRSTLVDGDIFVLLREDGKLQIVEAHRCRNPGGPGASVTGIVSGFMNLWRSRNGDSLKKLPLTVLGVELDEYRRRIAYWFTPEDVDPMAQIRVEVDRYPAYDESGPLVLHIFNPRRISQTRGVTAFAPVFAMADMFEMVNHAKLVQQIVASAVAFVRKRAPGFVGSSPSQMGSRQIERNADGTPRFIEEIGPGMIFDLDPGEELSGFSPNVPNAEFFEHVRLLLQLISINLGLPLVALLMDGRETNFSGWRGAMDQARIGFLRNQRWLRDRLLKPVWRWKLMQWIEQDDDLRVSYEEHGESLFEAKWTAPRWPYIQPLQDVQADDMRMAKRLSSPRRVAAERGADFWEIAKETVQDREYEYRLAIEAAERIRKEYGVVIDPMKFLSPDSPLPLLTGQMAADSADEKELMI